MSAAKYNELKTHEHWWSRRAPISKRPPRNTALGLGIVLDIVNAQTQLFNAQTSATQAVYDYELARANLERAVGRFAWADPGQVPPPQAPTTVPAAIAVSANAGSRR
jgi:hypothetical protein